MGGLFDTSVPGDDLFSVAPAVHKSAPGKAALDVMPMLGHDEPTLHDMLVLLESEAPLPVDDVTCLLSPTSDVGSVTSPDTLGDAGAHFLEGFTNLDEFLFTENLYAALQAETPMETMPSEVSCTAELKQRKRTAREALLDLGSECSSTSIVYPDHEYVSKKVCRSGSIATEGEEEVPKVSKEQKYRERRNKNNVASKRSRETRKQKFTVMEQKAVELEASNEDLELRIVELEELTKKMKDILVKRLTQTS